MNLISSGTILLPLPRTSHTAKASKIVPKASSYLPDPIIFGEDNNNNNNVDDDDYDDEDDDDDDNNINKI